MIQSLSSWYNQLLEIIRKGWLMDNNAKLKLKT